MTGKWDDPAVPKRDWSCVGMDDLGPDENMHETCEMCEIKTIRYVHVMQHENYEDSLRCGCVCAGHMEGDEEAVAAWERQRLVEKTGSKSMAEEAQAAIGGGLAFEFISGRTPSSWRRFKRRR